MSILTVNVNLCRFRVSIRKRQAKDLQAKRTMVLRKNRKREAEASLVLHAALFLEEIPCAESEGIHTAIFVGIE